MRKTFLKVALIGLLAAAMPSTFTSCKDYDDDITNLNTQTADLKSQLQSVNSTLSSLQSALTAAQSAADSAKAAAAAAQAAANKAQSTAEAAQAAAAAAEAEGKAAAAAAQAAAIAQAKIDLEAVRVALEAAIAGKVDQSTFNVTVEGINGQIADILGQIGDMNGQIGDMNGQIGDMNGQIGDMNGQIGDMNGQIVNITDKVNALLGDMTDAQGKITNLEGVVNNINTQLSSVKGQIETLEAIADALPAQFEAIDSKFTALENKLGEQNTELSNKINEVSNKIDDAVAKLNAVSDKNAAALETINGAITALNEKVEQQGQMIAALNAEIATLKAAQAAAEEDTANKFGTLTGNVDDLVAKLQDLKTSVETSLGNQASQISALENKITELTQKIELIGGDTTALDTVLGLLKGMLTHIEVVTVPAVGTHSGYNTSLSLYTVTVAQDLVFGQGYNNADGTGQLGFDKETFAIQNQEVFKKDEVKTFSDNILVRVSPANARITKEQIELVNTKGEDLNAYLEIESVKPYTGLLTSAGSRSIANNGLYEVNFAIKPNLTADEVKAYNAATNVNAGTTKPAEYVLYAVKIADDSKQLVEQGREITSAYTLQVEAGAPTPSNALNFDVEVNGNKTNVKDINNRFLYAWDQSNLDNSALMFPTFTNFATNMPEVYAKRVAQTDYEVASDNGFTSVGDFAWTGTKGARTNAKYDKDGDDRTEVAQLEVQLGETFTVDMSGYVKNNVATIYGFYVTLDMWRATESNGSEREAWKNIASSIEGINSVTTNSTIDLTISEDADIDRGEIIGFRVYAVNYDGTLVDPDGRAFYVVVDKSAAIPTTNVAVTLNVPSEENSVEAAVALESWTATIPAVNVTFEVNGKIITGQPGKYIGGNPYLKNAIEVNLADGTPISTVPTKITRGSDAAKAYEALKEIEVVMPTWEYADNTAYTGVITITDATTGLTLQTVNVSITKKVSDDLMPTGFGVTDAFPATGTLSAVITSSAAKYNISTMFNWGKWNNADLTSTDYTEVVTFQKAITNVTPVVPAVEAKATNGVFDLSTITLNQPANVSDDAWKEMNHSVINNGTYPMAISYTYGTKYSYVPVTDANGNVQKDNDGNVKYDLVESKFTYTRDIEFVTIASQLTLSWMPKVGNTPAYTFSLTYNQKDGKIDLNKVVATQDLTKASPWFNATANRYATVAELLNSNPKAITVATTDDVVLGGGLETYFTAKVNGTNIEFTPVANTETPMSNVTGTVTLNVTDGITTWPISLGLPSITMNK